MITIYDETEEKKKTVFSLTTLGIFDLDLFQSNKLFPHNLDYLIIGLNRVFKCVRKLTAWMNYK